MRPARWLVVAGEPSGDRLAARVVRAVRHRDFPWEFEGMAGAHTVSAGVTVTVPPPAGAMGLWDVLPGVQYLRRAAQTLVAAADRWDGALLVDFHGFTLPLGRALRARGRPVVLLSAPQVWAWRPGRARDLDATASAIGCLLDMEPPLLRALGVQRALTRFVGHPAADPAPVPRPEPRSEGARLAVLPGSRRAELRRLFPVMQATARALVGTGAVADHVTAVPPEMADHPALRGQTVAVGLDAARQALATASVALACSGTVTLECALAGVPTVVAYRTDPLTAAVARRVVLTPWIALPNILLGRPALPERVQSAVTVPSLAEALTAVNTPAHRERSLRDAAVLRARLTVPGGFDDTVVQLLVDTLEQRPRRGV